MRDAAVLSDGQFIQAFVVPDDNFLDDALGRKAQSSALVSRWRKTYDLSQLTKDAASAPLGFNTLGWNSSFTRQPISMEEMHEWVDTTVADILRLAPKSVYEIGCGTGLLLTRIAPTCDRYVGADFAPSVVSRLREHLVALPELSSKVELQERTADDFEGIGAESFDLVVINSVAQYFPDHTYCTKVLRQAVASVKSGGHIFIGDVRSLPLARLFATSVETFRAPAGTTARELRESIQRRIDMDTELVLSPAYFLSLQSVLPRISGVTITPRHGRFDNEMTRYRYQAILHIDSGREAASGCEFLDWASGNGSAAELSSLLSKFRGKTFGIQRIRNARLENDLELAARLDAAKETDTIETFRREYEPFSATALHPEDVVSSGRQGGFDVYLSWRASRHDGSYDALFVPKGSEHRDTNFNWPEPDNSEFLRFASAPRQGKLRNDLTAQLQEHCAKSLPESAMPVEIMLVDMLPRHANGQIDIEALAKGRNSHVAEIASRA